MSQFEVQLEKMRGAKGFVAALDQSGGSTPKALALYGIKGDAWANEEEMFSLVHEMRTRIMTSRAFDGSRVLAAILFENTLSREVAGLPAAAYLWQKKQVIPILKIDRGLADEADGVQRMKPAPGLDDLLKKAGDAGVFGTKMRSVIKQANPEAIKDVVDQQFTWARQVAAAGLVPIIEPEVDIHCPQKAAAEQMLKAALTEGLDALDREQVMFKLTLPEEENFYAECLEHPRLVRLLALSGGYPRNLANQRLAANRGMIASFSRALTEGLLADQSDAEFDAALAASIESIFQASVA